MLLDYCLGLLTQGPKKAFAKRMHTDSGHKPKVLLTQDMIDPFLHGENDEPDPRLKERTWVLIENVIREKHMDPTSLPLLNKYSEREAWGTLAANFLPKNPDKSRPYMRLLTSTDKVTQILIATNKDFPEEEHEDLLESFMILEGECECRIGDRMIKVRAGGYLEIPLHTSHDVKILSDGIIGILQRIHLSHPGNAGLTNK